MTIHDHPPRLIALTDRTLATAEETLRRFERLARAARPFTVMFQLRDRDLPARERLAFGRELRALCTAEEQWFQLNDRCDLAVLLAADAGHLGEASVSAPDARRIVGERVFVTRACHDPERDLEAGVDGWLLSPIFAERKGRAALGVGAVARLTARVRPRASRLPCVYALGGVDTAQVPVTLGSGAMGVAVLGAVLSGGDGESLLEALSARR